MDIQNQIYHYCEQVYSGKIVACRKYKWSALRYMRDCDRKDSPWVFNNYTADQYLNTWMPLFKHTRGLIVGQQKIAAPYEIFVYGNIYGWVDKETGYRRFTRTYEQIARKNAKSQDKAIQALYEMSQFGEPEAEVYVAATQKSQTRFVWGEASKIYQSSELLKDKFTTKYDKDLLQVVITHKKSGSIFARLSADEKKKGDGTNPHFGIIDEYHLHDTTEYYDLLTSGMMTRAQPLLSIITTAGFDLEKPCYRIEYDYVSRILNPDVPVENDRYFIAICELDRNESHEPIEVNGRKIPPGHPVDDIMTLEAVQKANPIIHVMPRSVKKIFEAVKEGKDKPEKMRDVLTKNFNFWVNQRNAGYMDMALWSVCGESDPKKLPDVFCKGYKWTPYGGLDLSSTIDLTSVSFLFRLDNQEYYVISHSFMPEDMITKASDRDHVRYDLWVDQGWITATPGSEVDYHLVLEWIVEQYRTNEWGHGEVCYDRALATWLKQCLEEKGFTPVDIPQSYTGLSLATKEFRNKVVNRKMRHRNDPVLTWAVGNAVVRKGPSENIMLDKSAARFRIDPVAASINAMVRAMVERPETTRGVTVIDF